MNRRIASLLLVTVAASVGMNGDGCQGPSPTILGSSRDNRPPPTVVPFGGADDTFTRSFSVDLHDYGETAKIAWEFGGDGSMTNLPVAMGKSVTHTFTRSGTFLVSVHLFGADDIARNIRSPWLASGVLPVEVQGPNALPTARFVVTQDASGPNVFRFNAASSTDPDGFIESVAWDFGDGSTETGTSVLHTFNVAGRYTVSLTVTDDRGATAVTTRSVLSNLSPTAEFSFEIDNVNGLSVHFDASASSDADGSIASFEWDFGDASPTETGAIVTHTYAAPDDYNVVLTVRDNLAAAGTSTQLVAVNGSEPFVRSVSPEIGEVDTASLEITIDGENFENGADVRLILGAGIISATQVVFTDASTLQAFFDLTGAPLGDYTVLVENPDTVSAILANGFRVVTPNHVRISTTMGDIVVELVDDTPVTKANFYQYISEEFYDGTIFHRVIPNFVVQGGGILPDGSMKPGLHDPIVNEFSPARSNVRGTVAMAKQGGNPDSAQAQFFVNVADNSANLDNQNGGFTVFANVIEGMDVADAMALVDRDSADRPLVDILINSIRRE